jgi:hypothetical protein
MRPRIVPVLFTVVVLATLLASGAGNSAASASGSPGPDPTCGLAWKVVPSPNQSGDNSLSGVAVDPGSGGVWAVGYYNDHTIQNGPWDQALIQRWDGSNLSVVTSPKRTLYSNYLSQVAVVSVNDAWAVGSNFGGSSRYGANYTTLTEHWDGTGWSNVPSPNISGIYTANWLNGAAVVSADNIWAIGYYDQASIVCRTCVAQTLVEHWDGAIWSIIASPNVGTSDNILNSVAVVSANDIWAVGWAGSRTLALHWDGSTWNVVPTPSLGTFASLGAVAAISSSDVWALGYYKNNNSFQMLGLHWDGTTWSLIPMPAAGTGPNIPFGVAAVSANDVWTVGYAGPRTLVLHWDGKGWNIVASPNVGTGSNSLSDVAFVSATNGWAVGDYRDGGSSRTLVLHWDGNKWNIVNSPNTGSGDNNLTDVTSVSANDAWAVGDVNGQTLAEHWNGSDWAIVSTPNISNGGTLNYLSAIAAVGANDIWAAGTYTDLYSRTLFLHWDGSVWSVIPSPSPGTFFNFVRGLAAVTSEDVWAAGYFANSESGPAQTLLLHWDGKGWNVIPSPNPGYLFAIAAVSAKDVWAVGYFPSGGGASQLDLGQSDQAKSPPPGSFSDGCGLFGPNSHAYDIRKCKSFSKTNLSSKALVPQEGQSGGTSVLHWNGMNWAVVPIPDVGASFLTGIAAASAHDVWAVGYYATASPVRPLILHWNGRRWRIARTPRLGVRSDNLLLGVAVAGKNSVWAVGDSPSYPTDRILGLHWDGTAWKILRSPKTGGDFEALQAVAAIPAKQAWGVGYYGRNENCDPATGCLSLSQTLITLGRPCPTPTPTITPRPDSARIPDKPVKP